ncbi:DUF2796 domain-containing protein [Pseudomonas sp. GD03721]|jgi:hypothetical protein|nr:MULTISPECIES: DUF2796 domain-containing protein [unclassified Pseudomonas]MDH1442599.1 DUF2796 domain-containing protein [Pseudomonas sp. GD03722]OZB22782.1 MAG: zinc-binding protein [Pseudomonas sp. 34-62-33]WGG02363.1 DUF2796 domain-containing protein [Pseudomonas sp. GD03721]WGG06532.1 DUF2796 domain-containing protein [Pseudomonas sp. GD03919]
MRHLLLALPFALLPLVAAQAHEHGHDHDHEHSHDSLGAHEHGVASLNAALDGNLLELQFESPAMNLVGFEHAAKSDADKAKVAAAKRELEQPISLFALTSGDCKATQVELQSPLFADKAHDHKHGHHDHKHEGEHSDIHAHYRFECAKANELKQLDLAELFKRFPATEKIQVQLIGPNGQQGVELTPAQPRLSF